MTSGSRRASAAAVTFAALAAACAHAPPGPAAPRASPPGLLRNADFEAEAIPGRPCPPSWGCISHSNPTAFKFQLSSDDLSRGQYLKVTRVKPEPWALVMQALRRPDLAGSRVRLSVLVNGERLEGKAGPVIHVKGAAAQLLDYRRALLDAGPGWRRATVEIDVPPGARSVEFGLEVEGGGQVGFDDAEATLVSRSGT